MAEGSTHLDLVARRAWRTYAAGRRIVSGPGRQRSIRRLARPRRMSLAEWHVLTSERHQQYRVDHPPCASSVSVICVTKRPERLDDVVANVSRQRGVDARLVLVPNAAGFDADEVERSIAYLADAVVVWPPGPESLGRGLNRGLDVATERFVAKFDDDDHYGPDFLVDSLRAHGYARSGVVGKHSYYADVDALEGRWLRFPGHEFSYGSTLAGGTLVIDRERAGDVRFPDVSLGEDRGFIQACHRRGVSTFAADRFNFVQRRGAHNTWHIPADRFVAGATLIDSTAPEHVVDR